MPPHGFPPAPKLPVISVNGRTPDEKGNVDVGIPDLDELKGKTVRLDTTDNVFDIVKILAEALGMQVGAGGSWTGTSYVSLGAFATKDVIDVDDLTSALKAQLKGEKGDKGDRGEQGAQGIRGFQGDRGEKGEKGDDGEKGDKGDRGEKGESGPQGDAITVTRIQETSESGGYNTLTLSDGSVLRIR